MSKSYIQRSLEPILLKAVKQFPAVVLTGPRQAGKTTLLKHLFSKTHRYLSLEPPDVQAAAVSDPRGFLELYKSPIILDEFQYAPQLLPYIKEKIDERRDAYGHYILTGSQNILLLQTVTETLAGRTAVLRLLPLSYPEISGEPFRPFIWQRKDTLNREPRPLENFWMHMLRGSYPELAEHPEKDALLWQGSYIQTYLERDIRTLRQVGDLTQFQLFLRALAARSGQLLQLSDLARDIGIAVNTAKAWLAVLEATYQVVVLRPYFANINKRLVKTPKVYFTDVGTLCYLIGMRDPEQLALSSMGGVIAETFVFTEIYKRISNQGLEPLLYFWRTSTGTEVDVLIEEQGKLIPVEIRASATPRSAMANSMKSMREDLGERVADGYVVYLGDLTLPLRPHVTALPLADL